VTAFVPFFFLVSLQKNKKNIIETLLNQNYKTLLLLILQLNLNLAQKILKAFTPHLECHGKACWEIEIPAQFQYNLSLSKLKATQNN